MERKGTFSIIEVILIYIFINICFILVSQKLYIIFGIPGIPITHLLVILLPIIILTKIRKKSYKEVFLLNKPDKPIYLLIGLGLWFLALIMSAIYASVVLNFLPEEKELIETFEYLFENTVLWQQVLMIGLMPAITEELLFRGLIFSSFLNSMSFRKAILISSAMFAAMHFSLMKFIPTLLLGIVFAYVVYKTNSIFYSMFLHFINNTFSVVIQQFTPNLETPQALILNGAYITTIIIVLVIITIPKKTINILNNLPIKN